MRLALRIGWLAMALMAGETRPASAQDVIARAVDGWSRQARQDGSVYFRCASRICAAGSVVSYKPQPHRPALTLTEFGNHHRGLAKRYGGTANMRDVRVTESPASGTIAPSTGRRGPRLGFLRTFVLQRNADIRGFPAPGNVTGRHPNRIGIDRDQSVAGGHPCARMVLAGGVFLTKSCALSG